MTNHALIAGQSAGKQRLNPPCPCLVPAWDLSTVLRVLWGSPFEQLKSTDLQSLSLKTALLLVLVSVKRVGDLQALSVDPSCLKFGHNDNKVVLRPRKVYVPKVPSTLFRMQVIKLSAFPLTENEQAPHPLCPVRTLRVYTERSGDRTKGLPVSNQWLSRWIVDAIALAYKSMDAPWELEPTPPEGWPPLGRGPAKCLLLISVRRPAGLPPTFARFYNLDIPAL